MGLGAGTAKSGARGPCPRRQCRRTFGLCANALEPRVPQPGLVGMRPSWTAWTEWSCPEVTVHAGCAPTSRASACNRSSWRRSNARMPVGAICHGVLLAARSVDPRTSRSVLYGRRTTALTWELERTGWRIGRHQPLLGSQLLPDLRRAPRPAAGYMAVQAEVTRALASPEDFLDVDPSETHARASGRTFT